MPHTSRKKKQSVKRIEVRGEDGWTRVTTTDTTQRVPNTLPAQKSLDSKRAKAGISSPPATTPTDTETATCKAIEDEFQKHQKRWLDSESHKELRRCLLEDVDRRIFERLDHCFVFGTGSFNEVAQGWIKRTHVALTQLAVFSTVIDTIEQLTGHRPDTFAQEPAYSAVDKEFLSRLHIDSISDPVGFKMASVNSFVYAPNAEVSVQLRILASNPSLAIFNNDSNIIWRNDRGEACTNTADSILLRTGDDTSDGLLFQHESKEEGTEDDGLGSVLERGAQVCERFMRDKVYRKLPELDVKDHPFHDAHLTFSQVVSEDIEREAET